MAHVEQYSGETESTISLEEGNMSERVLSRNEAVMTMEDDREPDGNLGRISITHVDVVI